MPNRPLLDSLSALIRPGLALALFGAAAVVAAQAAPHCVADANTLCFGAGDRFSATASFQLSPEGPTFLANAVPLTGNSGYFWFFDATNVELTVKVLNGCALTPAAYWVFAAGMTDVGVSIVVKDLQAHETRTYANAIGTPFVPILDTAAFLTCP